MPIFSTPFLGKTLLAVPALGLFLLPPGFVAASWMNVAGFARRSVGEKLMWSLVLSFPIATMITVLGGRFAGPKVVEAAFLVLAAVAVWLAVRSARAAAPRSSADDRRRGRRLLAALAGACVLLLVATAAVEIHERLYEGVMLNDWYVRLPVLWAAARSGVPPINPFFTLDGANPTLRYYYFFYVLCAAPMRVFHLDARSVLTSSTLWACASFFAICWLMLKYLVLPFEPGGRAGDVGEAAQTPHWNVRSCALVLFLLSLAGGLEVLPNLLAMGLGMRWFPSTQWWTAEGLSAWPSLLLFVPHHYAGLVCGLAGYLLLTLGERERKRIDWKTVGVAGVCFAAAIGTSTFIAFVLLASAGVLAVMEAYRGERIAAGELACALGVTILLDAFYLLETFLPHVEVYAPTGAPKPKHAITVVVRYWHSAYGDLDMILRRFFHAAIPHGLVKYGVVLLVMLMFYAIEYGFLWFVLAERVGIDRRGPMAAPTRALWVLVITGLAIATCLSSTPMQHGLNDLGRLATIVPRTVLLLWAAPMAMVAWRQWRMGQLTGGWRKFGLYAAVACLLVGGFGEAVNVALQRIYLALGDRQMIRLRDPFTYAVGGPRRLEELREAWDAIGRSTAPDATVQDNPDGEFQRAALLYLNRRLAAGDVECETSFGGDTHACITHNTLPLLALYAQPEVWRKDLRVPPDTGVPAFVSVCRSLRLSALIVTDNDPVWRVPDSWVWQEPAMYAGESVRVIPCPR